MMISVGRDPLVKLASAPEGVKLVLRFDGGDGGQPSPVPPASATFSAVAGQDLSMGRAVWIDQTVVRYASPQTPAGQPIWITRTGGVAGSVVELWLNGSVVEDLNWSFQPGKIFAGNNGILTQNTPQQGTIHSLAQALTATQIQVHNLQSLSLLGA